MSPPSLLCYLSVLREKCVDLICCVTVKSSDVLLQKVRRRATRLNSPTHCATALRFLNQTVDSLYNVQNNSSPASSASELPLICNSG